MGSLERAARAAGIGTGCLTSQDKTLLPREVETAKERHGDLEKPPHSTHPRTV